MCFFFIKMTVINQKDRKMKQNQVQYELDRKAAKISALSSGNFDKYGYLTSEDLKIKPEPTEKVRFEASPSTLKKVVLQMLLKVKLI